MFQILRLLLPVGLVAWVTQQVRKPSGFLGRRVVCAMNLSHATMTEWALKQLTVPKNAAILDVGCGGGPTIGALAALAPEGKVFIWAGLFGSKRGRGTRVECSCDRRRASSDRARLSCRIALPGLHVRHRHGGRDALLLA